MIKLPVVAVVIGVVGMSREKELEEFIIVSHSRQLAGLKHCPTFGERDTDLWRWRVI